MRIPKYQPADFANFGAAMRIQATRLMRIQGTAGFGIFAGAMRMNKVTGFASWKGRTCHNHRDVLLAGSNVRCRHGICSKLPAQQPAPRHQPNPVPAGSSRRRPFSRIRRKASWQEGRPSTRQRPYCTTPWALPEWPSTTTGLSIILFSRISFTSSFIEFSVINSARHMEI